MASERENWFNGLCKKFREIKVLGEEDSVDLLQYYILTSICYPITEYIVKEITYNDKIKKQALDIIFEQVESIYDYKYHFNTLKHMNNEKKFTELKKENLKYLYNDLYINTKNLLDNYDNKNISQKAFDEYIINTSMKKIYDVLEKEGYLIPKVGVEVFKNPDFTFYIRLSDLYYVEMGGTGTCGCYLVDPTKNSVILKTNVTFSNHIGNIVDRKFTYFNYNN